ncbi:MAG: c-type cytochrome [Deltaproteobacteria bacterium]|nr:c-type cytochrome [Deltaproteobacteria bacterium]
MAHNVHDHKKAYVRVLIALLVLTAITVQVAYHNFGIWNIIVALLVASIKASLVVLYFMHMKYDNRTNQVVFASAFVFLAIFVGITASDLFYRPLERPIPVEKTAEGGGVSAAETATLRAATPDLIAQGKTLYAQQCATCHGIAGAGDGPAAAALKPPPRDFTQEAGWKFGRSQSQLFKTLNEGSPGTPMPSFGGLPAKDRWALVHFIRTVMPNPPEDTPETIAAAGGGATEAPTGPRLPIHIAMQLMAEREVEPTRPRGARDVGLDLGSQLYAARCASCHGARGEGAVVRTVGVNPDVRLTTKPLGGQAGDWRGSEARFIRLISEGLPGFGKPGMANFTPPEWHALYEYVKSLAQ